MDIYLAPIKDITTSYYRNLYMDIFGALDACYAPFIATTHMRKSNSPLFTELLPKHNKTSIPLIPQLLGNDSEDFSYFAKTIHQLGYQEINWNIGCPSPKIIKKRKGSGILPYPDDIKAFLDRVCQDTSYQLSIKMRLGFNHNEEGQAIIELMNDYPIHNIIIHGRTGKMMYTGDADLDAFASFQNLSKHELIYNGDITSPADYEELRDKFPSLKACMIGRGLLFDPFLPLSIKGIHLKLEDKFIHLKRYHDGILAQYLNDQTDEKYLCSKMKIFWHYTCGLFILSDDLLLGIKRCNTLSDYLLISQKIFDCPLKS